MTTASMQIIYPGIQSTVQDLGRKGYLAAGIPPSGAMDSFALRMGNLLVKNPVEEAGIEMASIGIKAKFLHDTVIALTGAWVEAKINGVAVPFWRAVKVHTGDTLAVGQVRQGFRFYMCVAGGIDVPTVLGSKSTYAMGKMGGLRGRTLKKGDMISFGPARDSLQVLNGRRVSPEGLSGCQQSEEVHELRVVLGPQDDHVKEDSVATFLSTPYKASIHCNRVGYRFEGPQIFFKERQKARDAGSDPSNIVDDGNSIGAIQVPGGKEPICLGPDGVSMGGYVKIACLIAADMDRMAQVAPGDLVRFKSVSVEQAREILIRSLERVTEENIIVD